MRRLGVCLSTEIEAAGRSDLGLVRQTNQDAFGADLELGVFVVCDGMGGAAGGEIASAVATTTFLDVTRQELSWPAATGTVATHTAMERAAAAANRAVRVRAAYDIRLRGMGTTLVAARLHEGTLSILNVGDSRCYRMRGGELRQITVDHSYLKEQVERGLMSFAEAQASRLQSVITRAIGAETDVHPDIFREEVEPGDTLLLASDGLTRSLKDEEIGEVLRGEATADEICERLVQLANAAGGADNITCYVVRVAKR